VIGGAGPFAGGVLGHVPPRGIGGRDHCERSAFAIGRGQVESTWLARARSARSLARSQQKDASIRYSPAPSTTRTAALARPCTGQEVARIVAASSSAACRGRRRQRLRCFLLRLLGQRASDAPARAAAARPPAVRTNGPRSCAQPRTRQRAGATAPPPLADAEADDQEPSDATDPAPARRRLRPQPRSRALARGSPGRSSAGHSRGCAERSPRSPPRFRHPRTARWASSSLPLRRSVRVSGRRPSRSSSHAA
jgi:hypothetical protein